MPPDKLQDILGYPPLNCEHSNARPPSFLVPVFTVPGNHIYRAATSSRMALLPQAQGSVVVYVSTFI